MGGGGGLDGAHSQPGVSNTFDEDYIENVSI